MKQIFFRKGQVILEEVPCPTLTNNRIIIKTKYSAISTETEISSIRSSGGSLLKKAKNQTEKVKKSIELIKKIGINNALTIISNNLVELSPIGYSLAGVVEDLDYENINEFKVGDRVADAGNQYAYHAEKVAVPKSLVVKIPPNVFLEEASRVAIGAIALQG
ncbi:MAG: hypothetical protein NC917_04555 [Candidatus Omnitrophica bacterium]|nr:hypothetical protein [Candidatus Omnitrophota bacterium]